ncbi:hypothetical protein VIGAN_07050600, partial [Vigna angularis var. angularis]
ANKTHKNCHVIREKIQSGLLRLLPIPSYAQLDDMFIKALHPKAFTHRVSKIGLFDVQSPTFPLEGGITK